MLRPPTAVQFVVLMQLMASNGVPTGSPRSVQVEPPSAVLTTWDPVATHVVSLEQEMPSRLVVETGTVCGVHLPPPFVVFRMAAPGPPDDVPTAVQVSASAQEIPVKLVTVAGNVWADHDAPPLLVLMMLGTPLPVLKSPTAMHVELLTHETDVNGPIPDGIDSEVQLVPESVVPMTTALPKIPNPTAVQSAVLGHEIPLRPLTTGGIGTVLQA
jgi:hypothetical protein